MKILRKIKGKTVSTYCTIDTSQEYRHNRAALASRLCNKETLLKSKQANVPSLKNVQAHEPKQSKNQRLHLRLSRFLSSLRRCQNECRLKQK